ncbi:MAG: hypothetical protein FWD57_09850 [Polyangiaceae bacterium]|nr:hypothetical protein [Polyangiaceae bacterium]
MRFPAMIGMIAAASAPVVFGALIAVSCSASPDNAPIGGAGNGAGASGGSTANGGSSGDSGGIVPPEQDTGLNDSNQCSGKTFPGHLPPLDVYILLDATSSMNGSSDGPEKWIPTVKAIKDLVSNDMTKGMGVGMTYLPMPPPAGFKIPGSCPCEPGQGACALGLFGMMCDGICTKNAPKDVLEAECGLYGPCVPWPTAPASDKAWCNGLASKNVSCDPVDYGKPVVPIAELPGNKNAMIDAISAKKADGENTSTQPALDGTLRYAKQWAKDHPDHLVHVLFATDGEPISCTYNTIEGTADVAEKAYKQHPSVPTFVLGIGHEKDLDKIASRGGTGKAYIASASDVAQKLVDMFNEIRANGACQFLIPEPEEAGKKLDYDEVNVYYTPLTSDDPIAVGYVEGPDQCGEKHGWYYDDPTKTNPTKIILCPATCNAVQISDKGVSVELGCKTIIA